MIRDADGFQSNDDNISLSLRDVPKTPGIGSRVCTLPVLRRDSPLASSPVRGENQTLGVTDPTFTFFLFTNLLFFH
jgi:hypothetical protein